MLAREDVAVRKPVRLFAVTPTIIRFAPDSPKLLVAVLVAQEDATVQSLAKFTVKIILLNVDIIAAGHPPEKQILKSIVSSIRINVQLTLVNMIRLRQDIIRQRCAQKPQDVTGQGTLANANNNSSNSPQLVGLLKQAELLILQLSALKLRDAVGPAQHASVAVQVLHNPNNKLKLIPPKLKLKLSTRLNLRLPLHLREFKAQEQHGPASSKPFSNSSSIYKALLTKRQGRGKLRSVRIEDGLLGLSRILGENPGISRRGFLGGAFGATLAAACAPAAPSAEVQPAPQRPESQAGQRTQPVQPQQQRAPERPASVDTAGWKDYPSPLGFSIKYPPTSQIIHIPYSKEVAFVMDSPSNPGSMDGINIRITKSDVSSTLPTGQFIGSSSSLEERLGKVSEAFRKKGFAVEDLMVGGINAVRAKGKDAYYYFDTVYFTGANDWTVSLIRTSHADGDRARQVLDGMLTSFRLH